MTAQGHVAEEGRDHHHRRLDRPGDAGRRSRPSSRSSRATSRRSWIGPTRCAAWRPRQCRHARSMPRLAREFGAEGIGLCRTEHMFFDADRIVAMREMILASTPEGPAGGAGQDPADAAQGLHRAVRDHGRAAGDDPAARSAACMNSCRRATPRSTRWRGAIGADPAALARGWRSFTSSIRCSAIAACGSRSPIPRSPRCRRGPFSRRRPRSRAAPARRRFPR